jgi:hypothetical protein
MARKKNYSKRKKHSVKHKPSKRTKRRTRRRTRRNKRGGESFKRLRAAAGRAER